MLRSRFRSLALPAALLMASTFASAQKATPARITGPVIESERTRLLGNVSPLVRSLPDQGKASPAAQMTHVRLILSRTPQQQAALDAFLAQVQDKSSANYHKWLTPQQFGARFGASDVDIATIQTWLSGHGFKVEPVSPAHTTIAFSGSVSQVESAFEIEIHSFTASGQNFVASTKNPSIPSALAKVVSGVARLNTLSPTPQHIVGSMGQLDQKSKQLVAVNDAIGGLRPQLTTGSGTTSNLYVTPGDAATIYDTPNTTFNANYTSGTNYTGAGVVIGIGGRSAIKAATVAAYRTRFVGDSTPPTITDVDGVTSISDTDEAYIDTQLPGGIAPGATIHYYTAIDLFDAIQRAIDDNVIDIFSLSYGVCEAALDTSDNVYVNGLWQQAFAQGIAVTVSTGDSGSAGCDPTTDNSGNSTATAQYGLQVNALASTPYNIAVGGTDYAGLLTGFSTYVGDSTSGNATNLFRSAKSYIPESTWNDSTQVDGAISANTPYTGTNANIVGGSGGQSSCSVSTTTTCTSGYAKPSWQRGTGVPADTVRDLPDISLLAGNGADAASWLICTDDTGIVGGVSVTANCTDQSNGKFYFFGFGGTSTAAPAFAGVLALVQEKTGSRLGQAAAELYDLYNGSHASAIFHDTTVGNNSVPCTTGTPNCTKNTAGYYYLTGYDTTTGYDLATGLGSVDVKQLITYWGTAVGADKSTITVVPSVTTVSLGQNVTVTATVAGTSVFGSPTGTVTLAGGSYTSSAVALNSAGKASFTVAASKLAVGVNKLTASYSGDTYYATATGNANVTLLAPIVTLSPTALTFPATVIGASNVKTITVTNSGTAPLIVTNIAVTGSAVFTATNNCSTVAVGANCTITVTFIPTTEAAASGTVTITDNGLDSPQTIALAGTTALPAVTLSPAALSFPATAIGSSNSQTITVKNTGLAPLTITAVSITGNAFTQNNNCSTVAAAANCTVTVVFSPTSAAASSGTVTITDNATGSPQTVALTGTTAFPAITLSPTSLSFSAIAVGTTSSKTIAVQNSGTAPLIVTGVAVTAGAFTQTNNCATVAASASCTVTVTYSPTLIGAATGTVTITDNATGSPQTVALTGTAVTSGTFTVAGSVPSSITRGSTATSTITATGTGGYQGTIALTCSVAAISGGTHTPTCSAGSSIVIGAGSSSGTSTITLNTTAAAAMKGKLGGQIGSNQTPTNGLRNWGSLGGIAVAGLLLFGIPARRRNLRAMLGVLVLCLAGLGAISLSGCGGGGSSTPKDPGTTAGAYTVNVTATDSAAAITQTTTVTLTVN